MRQQFLISLGILFSQAALSQHALVDTSHYLPAFELVDNRLASSNPGLNHLHLSPAENHQQSYNLGDLLVRNTATFIKQYSQGTLASPSLRGSGSAHTAIVWNGLSLQSSMNGQTDLSLISSSFFDQLTIQEGAAAATWGSGAIGGILFLESSLPKENQILIGQTIGSWGFSQQQVDAALTIHPRVQLRTRLLHSSAINNFAFLNLAHSNPEIERQTNANQQGQGIMQDLHIKTGKFSQVDLSAWVQENRRHIPPIITIPVSVAHQFDQSRRFSGTWKVQHKRSSDLKITAGYLSELIHYVDSLFLIDSRNTTNTLIQESVWGKSLKEGRHRIEAGYNFTRSQAKSPGFGSVLKFQQRFSIFGSIRSFFHQRKTQTLLVLRQEAVEGLAPMTIPSFSIQRELNKTFALKAQVARTYRIPTLNDLYWQPGGNPSLLSEKGFAYEGGIHFTSNASPWNWQASTGVFSTQVDNWIQWLPGAIFWSPQNLLNVVSQGLEFRLKELRWKVGKKQVKLSSHWQYVRSRIHENPHLPQTVGKQLIYTPYLTGNDVLSFSLGTLQLDLIHGYTGFRYTTSDNASSLPAFHLFHASLSQEISVREYTCTLFVQVNNLGNTTYHVISLRPMPLRSWMTGIQFKLKS